MNIRIHLARERNCMARRDGIRNREHQDAGIIQSDVMQHLFAGRVAINNPFSLIGRFANGFCIQFHHQIGDARAPKHLRQITTVETIADYDDMSSQVRLLWVESRHRWFK